MPWALVVGLLLLLLYVGEGDPIDGGITLLNEITRGRRVSHAKYGDDGVVDADPQQLANDAGVDLDTMAAARMLSSEEGQSSNLIKAAVCWALVNHARRAGKTVADVLLWARDANHSGYFGTFKNIDEASAGYGGADRYASTALDPYQGDVDIASQVLTGVIGDMTGGADQFDRPAGEQNPDAIAAKRTGAGAVAVNVPGIDPGELRFWRNG